MSTILQLLKNAKEWENLYHVNINQKKSGVSLLILDKVYFKMIYKPIHPKDIAILNIYVSNKIHGTKTYGTEKRNRWIYNYDINFQYSSLNNW